MYARDDRGSRCRSTRTIGSRESAFLRTSKKKPLPTDDYAHRVGEGRRCVIHNGGIRGNTRERVAVEEMWAPLLLTWHIVRLARERALPPGCCSFNAGDGVDRRRWQGDDAARAVRGIAVWRC